MKVETHYLGKSLIQSSSNRSWTLIKALEDAQVILREENLQKCSLL